MATHEVAQSVPVSDAEEMPLIQRLYGHPPAGHNRPPRRALAKAVAGLHALAGNADGEGWCYFIGGEDGPVKIGFSRFVEGRLKDMCFHSPIKLLILATVAGGRGQETAYHDKFAAHRLHGEWFERCPEIEAEIERLNA